MINSSLLLTAGIVAITAVEEDTDVVTDGKTVTTISVDESGDKGSLPNDLGLISILVVLVEKLDFGELSSELGVSMSLSSNMAINFDLDCRFAIC